jgi:two-component system, OmpR family, alkaline phosphatase synthesis response regulator PhoP
MSKILIVDDEPHIRRLLQETLEDFEDQGVQIFTAQNGGEGVEIILKEKPDIVYLDVMMPEMNGYDLCRKIREEYQMKDVKIIMLTAKGQIFDKQKAMGSGVDMYITKPFDPDFIIKTAEDILGIHLEEE